MATADKGFLPYQQAWLKNDARVKIWEKSRRIGATWAQSYEDVVDVATKKVPKVYFSSADESAAKEYIEYCEHWAERLNYAAEAVGEEILDKQEGVTALKIAFANGGAIYALSSNPKRFRSKGGKIILDEFAHHENQERLWAAARPAATWGYPVRILSTHNSKSSFFYKLIKEVKEGKRPWYHQKTDIRTAVQQGLVDRIYRNKTTAEQRAAWLENEQRDCATEEIWQEEYCCEPSDEARAFMTYDLISGIETENVLRPLGETRYDLYVGVDIGRRRDLTVIWAWEKVGNILLARLVKPMEKTLFRIQRDELWKILELKNVRRCCIDETGIGMQLAEETEERFGGHRVEKVYFTSRAREEMAYPLRSAAEDKTIRIPADRKIREDWHSLRKSTTAAGHSRLEVDKSAESHADYFWAAALGHHASGEKLTEFQAKTAGKRETQRTTRDYGRINYGGY